MLGGAWILLTVALLIPALIQREPPLFLVTILFFFTGGLARLWAKYLFAGVEYSKQLSSQRAFHGDEVTLEVRLSNRKILPLPWFRITEEVPEEVAFLTSGMIPYHSERRRSLTVGLSLRWYHRLTLRYVFRCTKRGTFQFGPTRLEAGDMFGFFRREMSVDGTAHLFVYPKIVPLERLGIPSKELFGDIRVRRHLFEDPVRVVATRDYVAGDPMKRIHWKTSARVGRMQSKVFDPTTSTDAAVFLDTRTVPPPHWGFVEQLLELGITASASIASYAQEQGIRMGLYANYHAHQTDRLTHIPPSSHPDQLVRILEALAQAQPQELMPIGRLVQLQGRSLPWGTTLVVITAVPMAPLLSSLVQQRRAGRRVALVVPGGKGGGQMATGIPTYYISDATPWHQLESVSIGGGIA